jgi:hypothetical protein
VGLERPLLGITEEACCGRSLEMGGEGEGPVEGGETALCSCAIATGSTRTLIAVTQASKDSAASSWHTIANVCLVPSMVKATRRDLRKMETAPVRFCKQGKFGSEKSAFSSIQIVDPGR